MENKKIERDNYNIHIIKTDRFKAINVDVYFSKKANKSDFEMSNLLYKVMMNSTLKYNSISKLNRHLENLYGASLNSTHRVEGNLEILSFGIEFINPKYTEEIMLKKSLDMLKEFIFNPNVKNDSFDKESFTMIKKNILNSISSALEDPTYYSSIKYKELMYNNSIHDSSILGDINNYDKITSKSLYSFYKKILKDYSVNIIVVGNIIDEKGLIKSIDSMFKNIKSQRQKIKMISDIKITRRIVKREKQDFNQSQLLIGYKFNNLTEYERCYVIDIYNMILGVINNSILFTSLREDNSMCYSVSSRVNKYYPSITITSAINKDNYTNAVEIIKECIELMNSKEQVNKLYNSALKTINTILNSFYDSYYSISNHFLLKEFIDIDDVEERKIKLNKVSIDDILNVSKKMRLSVVYFLEGDKK